MSQFSDTIAQGVAAMEAQCGIPFVIDGRTGEFIGVINSHRRGERLGIGGYAEDADAILMANKTQFGSTPPRNKLRVTAEGRRYLINATEEDSSTYTLYLMGVNK